MKVGAGLLWGALGLLGCGADADPTTLDEDAALDAHLDATTDRSTADRGGLDVPEVSATRDAVSVDARDALDVAMDQPREASVEAGSDAPIDRTTADVTGPPTAESLLALTRSCMRLAGSPLYATDVGASANLPICTLRGALFWHSDMDIDCDGGRTRVCRADPSYQPDTSAVTSTGQPLDAETVPFVVIPLQRTGFSYRALGIQLGSVAAVLYGGRMAYAVFGDEGPSTILGEGSYALARLLGIDPDPSTGGVDSGVTFIVFTGATGVVMRNEDHAEATRVGEARARQLLAEN